MMLRRREIAEAAAELDAALDWYAEQRKLLAVEFLEAVEGAIARVLDWPDSGRPYPGRASGTPVLRTTRVQNSPTASSTSSTGTTS